MRRLSGAQARRCEKGEKPRCRCRCGGQYHGSQRSQLPEFYEALPPEDPHVTRRVSKQFPLPSPFGDGYVLLSKAIYGVAS